MKPSLPRGMRDLEPSEFAGFEKIREVFWETCRLFGYQPMEPSPIEFLETLEAKSGPSIREEIYHFKDRANRDLGLRFDLTIGMTRYVASRRDLRLPVRLAACSSMWRYDEPQYGRHRWFYQWDIEVFGLKSIEADAEVMEFTSLLFDRLGLDRVYLEVGDRRVVEEFIREHLEIRENSVVLELMRAIDKASRKGWDEIIAEYTSKGISDELVRKVLGIGSLRGKPSHVLSELSYMGLRRLEGLEGIVKQLEARGVKRVRLSMSVVRGIDYYTGLVFEAVDEAKPELGSLAGGGRYDSLPAIFSRPDITATGVAGGVDRILMAMGKAELGSQLRPDVYLAHIGSEASLRAAKLASSLRRNGFKVLMDQGGRSLSRQLEEAHKRGSRFTLIMGPKEASEGKVLVRDMKSGNEERLEEVRLSGWLSGAISQD